MDDSIVLNTAGFFIKINFRKTEWQFAYKELKDKIISSYKGFIVKKYNKIDYSIDIIESPNLLITEKNNHFSMVFFEKEKRDRVITFYQISVIQFQVILREILIELLESNGFILHASASKVGKKAVIFTGSNGAGKSTAMTLLHHQFQSLGDDTVIIKKEKNNYFMYQTPFIEKNSWVKKDDKKYMIAKIFFLNKAKYFKTIKINNKQEVRDMLLAQFWSSQSYYKKQAINLLKFITMFNQFEELYFMKNKKSFRGFLFRRTITITS